MQAEAAPDGTMDIFAIPPGQVAPVWHHDVVASVCGSLEKAPADMGDLNVLLREADEAADKQIAEEKNKQLRVSQAETIRMGGMEHEKMGRTAAS